MSTLETEAGVVPAVEIITLKYISAASVGAAFGGKLVVIGSVPRVAKVVGPTVVSPPVVVTPSTL